MTPSVCLPFRPSPGLGPEEEAIRCDPFYDDTLLLVEKKIVDPFDEYTYQFLVFVDSLSALHGQLFLLLCRNQGILLQLFQDFQVPRPKLGSAPIAEANMIVISVLVDDTGLKR